MSHLFDPFTLRGVTLRNRIGVSPMCMYSYTNGMSNDWQLAHLGARAMGGAGLIIAEATAVEARGRISPDDVGIWSDAHIEPLVRLTRFLKQYGAVPGIQIAHAGRKAGTARPWDGGRPFQADDPRRWAAVGASPLPFGDGYPTPQTLTGVEIHAVQAAFVAAAQRALAAGFEWLEIHAAHGYLIHSFYSPLSNQRTDEYGGSFANRVRFLLETAAGVRAIWPDRLPLTVRISGTDWTEGAWTVADSIELARCLKDVGVDLVDCSSGGNNPAAHLPLGPGYQVPISEAVRHGANIATAAVGLITSPAHADEIIRNGRADIVLLGREMLRDPYWAVHAAQTLKQPAPVPLQYLRAN
jgi:2,4-dienoyl-CoA reductase-like NADH-dependent reductase (Old Yellow Enzyme family)